MRRHVAPFFLRHPGAPRPLGRLIVLSTALAFVLSAVVAFSQDTTPPAPPPDETAANPALAPGQSTVRAVRISDVEGKVQVFENGQVAFEQALPNMPAVEGMRFVTGDNGRLEIEFEDGSVARVTPDSSIRLAQLRRNADGSTVTAIDALTGLSYYELNSRGTQYTVHFGEDTATPIQDAVFRVALDAAPWQLAVMHGSAHVDDGGGLSVDVKTDQTFQTDPQQGGEFTLAQSIAADSWDQWNSYRDQSLSNLEANQTMARASSGDVNNPAWNDLDYYGSWYNVPGYGEAWAPSGVGAAWDPFGNGAWGYYPGFGYTWISGYPWGWMPYHCGAWDYMNSFGWMWMPGNCGYGLYGAGWYPYATVWNVPRGYVPPQRPRGLPVRHIGSGPVGPHPLAAAPRLVTVNRGEEFSRPFQPESGVHPQPRPLTLDGKTVEPLEAGIHPIQRGPIGESFTSALVRTHPELGPIDIHGDGARSAFMPEPGRPFGAPARFGSTPVGRGGYAPGLVNHGSGGFHPGATGAAGGFHGGGGAGVGAGGGFHGGGSAPAASGGGGAHH
ncbi:MAG TPA: DUF6600 domain-containing protein [Acidobacteriaceae bacterium]|nr:DUF6600 domain-containing protein [Acidobacteriaceae bacterium]